MKLTTLVDNTRLDERPDLSVERGLSFHIDTMGKQLLFDTGSGSTFIDNAKALDVDIEQVDMVVISHRHHDHCNGTKYFTEQNSSAKVYLKHSESQDFYFRALGFKSNVGIDKAMLQNPAHRFIFLERPTEIAPNIHVITEIGHKHPKPKGNQYLYTKTEAGLVHDSFEHEQILVIEESDGLVIFTGCAHSGVLNMIETVIERFPQHKIKAVVGGFHLVGLPIFNSIGGTSQEIREIGRVLAQYPIDMYYTGHCTGMKAYQLLKDVLGERLELLPTGRVVTI